MTNNHFPTGQITKIEQQKKRAHRYNIYINHHYAFSAHEDVLVSLRITVGKHLTREDMQILVVEEEKKKMEQAAVRYLAFRPRSMMEVYNYLQHKGFDEALIGEIVQKLSEKGYINDQEFCRQWVKQRIELQKKGPRLLKEELKQKGIPLQYIEEALTLVDEETEYYACFSVAEKKAKSLTNLTDLKQKQKLFHYLLRKGYSYSLIQQVYQRLVDTESEMEFS